MLKMDDKDGDGKVSWEEFSGDKGTSPTPLTAPRPTTTTTKRKPMKIPVRYGEGVKTGEPKGDTKTSEKPKGDTKASGKTKGDTKANEQSPADRIISEKIKGDTKITEKIRRGQKVISTSKGKRSKDHTTMQSEL